jgi:hypothetical protein
MMNLRGSGRGYTRGGRGRGRSSYAGRGRGTFGGRTSTFSKSKHLERELKFSPHQYQGKTQAATYATTKDAIIQHVQKSYKGGQDVSKSLEDMIVVDLANVEPTRSISSETDPAVKVVDQAGLDIKYQEELRRHLDRKDALREGLNKAYALIFANYCTKTMQSRIEEHPDYESTLKNNPIAVLEAIKTLMHGPVQAQYPLVSMTDALSRLVNAKQQESETLLDYVKCFKQLRDIAKSQLGNTILNEFVEHQTGYAAASTNEKLVKKQEAYPRWMAYLLIHGTDQTKYGSLQKGFVSQFLLGNDQYPKSITAAIDVLSNHKIDQRYYDNQKKSHDRLQDERSMYERQTTDENPNATSFAHKTKK